MDFFKKLLNKTYRYLSYRPRSEKEVRDYLKRKKSDDVLLERIIQNLKLNKFLDDVEFAKWWIEQRSTIKPKSTSIIKLELKQKGIAKELIDSLFEDNAQIISDFEKAYALAVRKVLRFKNLDKHKAYEKLGRYLASKGFNWDTIKDVVDKVLK